MNRIVSSLPGRLRLRDVGLRRSPRLGRLCAVVSGYQGVVGIEQNRHAGSVTVFYDVAQVTRRQIEARIEAAAARMLDAAVSNGGDELAGRDDASAGDAAGTARAGAHSEPAGAPDRGDTAPADAATQPDGGAEPLSGEDASAWPWAGGRRGGTLRVRVNRVARRGMLASLAASMVLAALGRKRWHTVTGIVFLKFLAMHLWVHRRHLVR